MSSKFSKWNRLGNAELLLGFLVRTISWGSSHFSVNFIHLILSF